MKKILIACEESQSVTIEFRKLGYNAFSCDIQSCSGGHQDWHIKGDVLAELHKKWDAVIAFPPCTHLCSSGARWFKGKRADGRQDKGVRFFMEFANLDCPFVAIENPIGIMSTKWRKPDQIIHPWMFGHGETKATCLWLKGFNLITPTKIVKGREQRIHLLPPSFERSKIRSKTFNGIAKAMAVQWGKQIHRKKEPWE